MKELNLILFLSYFVETIYFVGRFAAKPVLPVALLYETPCKTRYMFHTLSESLILWANSGKTGSALGRYKKFLDKQGKRFMLFCETAIRKLHRSVIMRKSIINVKPMMIGMLILILTVFSKPLFLHAETLPIRIGASVSLEGKYEIPSWMTEKGYELWANQVNRRRGILGRKVKLVLYDDKSRLDLVRPLYEKMITEDHVDFVLSPYGSTLTFAASEISEAHHYVMLACEASSEKIWQRNYRYIFGVYAPAGRYMIGFQELMAKNGFKTLGVVFENSSFNTSIARGVKKWTGLFGMDLIYTQSFHNGDKEFPVILQHVMKKNPDGLIFSAYPPDSYNFIDLMKKENYHPMALAFTIVPASPDFYQRTGPFAEGIFGPSQWEPDARLPFPGTVEFIHNFKKFTGKMPDYHACSAFSACQILERAINQVKSFNQDKIRDFILALDTLTVMGRFKVNHTGLQIGHNPMIIQWQHGKKEIVYPPSMETAAPEFKVRR